MKLRKSVLAASLAIPLGIASTVAQAGFIQPQVVVVDLVAQTAQGDQWTARNEAGDGVFIGCGLRSYDDGAGGTYSWGFCQAEDAEGDEVACNTENAGLIEAIAAQDDYSFITFSWRVDEDVNGNEVLTCDFIGNSTQSFYLPRTGFKAN